MIRGSGQSAACSELACRISRHGWITAGVDLAAGEVQTVFKQSVVHPTGPPGPARVSVDVVPTLTRAMLIDASAEMLTEAGRRLDERGVRERVALVRADAFSLPLRETADLVYTFRLIRHFDRADRLRLYREIAAVLRPGGWLVFDAVNRVVSAPLRAAAKPGEFQHFDALLTPEELREELGECGFSVTALQGVQHRTTVLGLCQIYLGPRSKRLSRLAMEVIDRTGGQPLEWVVTCRRG